MGSQAALLFVTFAWAATCTAQPVFEVVSIKPALNSPAGARAISLTAALNHGRLSFEAVTLRDLIQQAYDLSRDRISGCPAWCESERFDVTAKAEDPDVKKDQAMQMLQALLAGRFKLTLRREMKERSGYALELGKSGSKLKPSAESEKLGFSAPGYLRVFQAMPMAGLVSFVSSTAGAPVTDATGLQGAYDFTIDLTPPENDAGDLFSRLREALGDQLGLKLEPRRIAVENLIIERAEKPSPN